MILWTWHNPGFDLLSGKVDPHRSMYYSGTATPTIKPAYHRLWEQIGTSQFIWCYSAQNVHSPSEFDDQVEWRLSVPDAHVLAILDVFIWNKILGLDCGAPSRLRHQWKSEAIRRFPTDADRRRAYEEEQLVQYNSPIPPEQLWKLLFIQDATAEAVNVLIPHPLIPSWVLEKKLHKAKYPAGHF